MAGEKSKLLVICTKELRRSRVKDNMEILVEEKNVVETPSEKLLVLIISSDLTWKEHLYAEEWRQDGQDAPGLISQLSQRVGIIRKLSRFMSKKSNFK